MSGATSLPLAGIRVLDLSRLMAGNMLTLQLADFGADVIKVESEHGDTLRDWKNGGKSIWWKVYARNKRSICLDLKNRDDVDKLLALVPQAQVLVESFKSGGLESYGLSPEVLHQANPKLVIVRISGWGQTGPYATRPGFGTLVEAFSGFAEKNGFPDKPPACPARSPRWRRCARWKSTAAWARWWTCRCWSRCSASSGPTPASTSTPASCRGAWAIAPKWRRRATPTCAATAAGW
jgi:crotonobetainyl-CoA:carnitine CoA-transferase CaiB-like acyl-CoA transferase